MATLQLNDETFLKRFSSGEKMVVMFTASWCGSCQILKPDFEKLAEQKEFSQFLFTEIDAEESLEAKRICGIRSVPFFTMISNGKIDRNIDTDNIEDLLTFLTPTKFYEN